MTEPNQESQQHDVNAAIRLHILARAKEINEELLVRLTTVAGDLDAGSHLAALGGLDGIERELTTIRSILLLLS